jgi:putative OPT family oligopeptide transporter
LYDKPLENAEKFGILGLSVFSERTGMATPNNETPHFQPYVSDEAGKGMKEFTWSAVLLGTLLGLVFAASSLYLVLKVGITVSASIPVAVLAITLFRVFSRLTKTRQATILENNIVQTSGSAGESIAFGVGVTMPALLLLGYEMDISRIMLVSVLGGLLGILAMIPLRRAFIVKMHGKAGEPGKLLYPEGTACAQVLISGEKGGTTGKTVFIGFGIAFLHKFLTDGMSVLMATVAQPVNFINKAAVYAHEMASELLGVGYIIGFRTAAVMMSGAILGYLVIIPTIYMVGEYTDQVVPPGTMLIRDMSISEIRNKYLLFIGAGCVATAGIISMGKTMPTIIRGIAGSLRTVRGGGIDHDQGLRRTENDMPMSVVLFGSLSLIVILAFFLAGEVGITSSILGAILVVLFGFLFVTVSARLTGEIGSSSNPISGMTVATLMLTCLIFVTLGMTSTTDRLLALSIAAVVCVASSNGGTTAQALKTGFLVGGTPKYAQYAILIGALASALVIGYTLLAFNKSRTVFTKKSENLPRLVLNRTELDRLSETVEYEGKTYKVWRSRGSALTEVQRSADGAVIFQPRDEVRSVTPGIYFVDPESGRLQIRRDDAIMGELKERDDGTAVKREFDAPKTQVMGLIINGVLKGDLNWTMVGIGAMIAIFLELCGVSSLAFAVGVYVPIQYSAPIFVGGIIRLIVEKVMARRAQSDIAAAGDDPEARARAEVEAIRKSETSPGVLLASGYIAGGSLASVLLAFLAFSDEIPKDLTKWQYSKVTLSAPQNFDAAVKDLARTRYHIDPDRLDPKVDKEKIQFYSELKKMNEDVPIYHIKIEKGTRLKLPKEEEKGEEAVATEDTTLGQLGAQILGRERKAIDIFNANPGLKLPPTLPAGAELKIPQSRVPAITGFLLLSLLLLAVGFGWIMKGPEENRPTPTGSP